MKLSTLILKTYLFFFNILLWLVAVGILGGVGYYFYTTNQYRDIATNNSVIVYTIIPLVIIVLVALMLLLLSVLGLISACCDVKVLIAVYGILLACVVTAQVGGGVLVVVFRGPVLSELEKGLNNNFVAYNDTPGVKQTVDSIQRGLQCCGVNESSDWISNVGILPPESCCIKTNCDRSDTSKIYTEGCVSKLTDLIIKSSSISISIAVLLALLQYSGVVVAFILACCCRKKGTEDMIEAKRMLPKY